MKTTPAAWMHEDGSVITAEKKTKAEQSSSIQAAMVSGYATPLHAIPDTHRVVSVERITTVARDVEYSPHTSRHTPFLRINFAYDDYDSRDKVYAMLAAAKEKGE